MNPTASRAPRDSSATPRRRGPLGVIVGMFVGAGIMLLAATTNATSGIAASDAQRTPPPGAPGTCLSWRHADMADATGVDCASPHLFELADTVRLADFPAGSPLPDGPKLGQLVNERCTPLVDNYLGGRYDPDGAFRASALTPTRTGWAGGDRSLRCGLQRFSRSGALNPIVGAVAGQDQSDIHAPGICLGIDAAHVGDPVGCAVPHAIESVGWVDLGKRFTGAYPSIDDQDKYLQPQCAELAGDYAGDRNVITAKGLFVLWNNLTKESWTAGSRKVACNLAAPLPDRSGFAPIVGSVRGPVQIGGQPGSPTNPGATGPGGPSVESQPPLPASPPR
ncbi:septum formation family protein [Pseudonocardia spinosispora]|uniref:septum formation family protein n=1 Tax=Pseudonocardia spinosispora TaxID=103441 RepID=UPI000A00F132|nr:septum formation family protein [Pseudonocardia spinosispora]